MALVCPLTLKLNPLLLNTCGELSLRVMPPMTELSTSTKLALAARVEATGAVLPVPAATVPIATTLLPRPELSRPLRSSTGASSTAVTDSVMVWFWLPVAPAASVTET